MFCVYQGATPTKGGAKGGALVSQPQNQGNFYKGGYGQQHKGKGKGWNYNNYNQYDYGTFSIVLQIAWSICFSSNLKFISIHNVFI